MEYNFFTSESVTEGHPDKVCDQISDAVLDEILRQDPQARVACETCAKDNFILIMGEVTTSATVDIDKIARDVIREIGYNDDKLGFCADTVEIKQIIDKQSVDIAMGVDHAMNEEDTLGAGDQGMMFGYATNETEELMPYAISLAHKLSKKLSEVRKSGVLSYLRPDGKTQVTVEYNDDNITVKRIDAIVVSTQHDENISMNKLRKDVLEYVIKAIVPNDLIDDNTKIYINPTGRFVIGGPVGDSGLTGRKIIVDSYGGSACHGGGAFSGKDCTKVDRSASYFARYVAKNIVRAGIADKCEIQVSYAIGVAEPTSIKITTFGTEKKLTEPLYKIVKENFDFTPKGIIEKLDLRRPIYKKTASYGHFGKEDAGLPWEGTDMVETLRKYIVQL